METLTISLFSKNILTYSTIYCLPNMLAKNWTLITLTRVSQLYQQDLPNKKSFQICQKVHTSILHQAPQPKVSKAYHQRAQGLATLMIDFLAFLNQDNKSLNKKHFAVTHSKLTHYRLFQPHTVLGNPLITMRMPTSSMKMDLEWLMALVDGTKSVYQRKTFRTN